MWPDRVSNSGPLTYESGALPTALRVYCEISESIPILNKKKTNKILGAMDTICISVYKPRHILRISFILLLFDFFLSSNKVI